jgi:hypothetical protein
VHAGIPYAEHRIHDLGDGHELAVDNVWDVASRAGQQVWVCGSMNATYRRPLCGWFLPDPWTTRVPPFPGALEPYYRFVQAHVTEYTSDRVPVTLADRARFADFMIRHGLSLSTAREVARQLASEAATGGRTRWKRASLLDRLQFDLFRWYYRRARPQLSTFFINSTAHYQHLYWRHMEPERFEVQPEAEEVARYRDAIPYGYRAMDELCGRFLELAGGDATLVFCTALSQQPYLLYEDQGGKTIYRPRDFARFLGELGVSGAVEVAPVMAHQFQIHFSDEAAAAAGEETLGALEVPGVGRALNLRRKGSSVFAGCRVFREVPPDAVLYHREQTLPFFDLFYHVDLVKSGMHHPEGLLWIRTPTRRHAVHRDRVPLVSLAPTVLELLGLPRPAHMKGDPLPLAAAVAA